MWAARYWNPRYWAKRYWPAIGAEPVLQEVEPIVITVEAYDRTIGVPAYDRTVSVDAYDRTILVPDVRGTE